MIHCTNTHTVYLYKFFVLIRSKVILKSVIDFFYRFLIDKLMSVVIKRILMSLKEKVNSFLYPFENDFVKILMAEYFTKKHLVLQLFHFFPDL